MTQISQKELMYLEEALSMEAKEVEKFSSAANQAQDPQVKMLLNNISNLHQNHFNTFKQYLDNNCQ